MFKQGPPEVTRSRAPVVVVSEFDGMHPGHARLVGAARELGERRRAPVLAVVLDIARRDALSDCADRRRLLAGAVDEVLVVEADPAVPDVVAEAVLQIARPDVVVLSCRPAATVPTSSGPLAGAFAAAGIGVLQVERAIDPRTGREVTANRVRELVGSGHVQWAARLMAAPVSLGGIVAHGRQLGRQLGFPTANVHPPDGRCLPRLGVYAGRATVGARRWSAAINVGVRPTVDEATEPLIEAHLLDFDGDLYGQAITVEFHEFLRPETRFAGVDELRSQLTRDVGVVRRGIEPPTALTLDWRTP